MQYQGLSQSLLRSRSRARPLPSYGGHVMYRVMVRTTIMLPAALKTRAERRARARGTSLGGLIREALTAVVETPADEDPLFSDDSVYRGPTPHDLAEAHDRYLYGEQE